MATNDLLVGYTRRFSGPVDATATFSTLSALQTYASSDATAYAGQICAVTGTNTVYVINSDKTVSAVGEVPTLCPFNAQSSLTFSYDGSGNITTLTYSYGGTTQGYADFVYSGGNLSTITYKGPDHSTVLRTITFSYSGSNISGYTVS